MTLYALADRRPEVADDAWVAPGCHVIGNVILEIKKKGQLSNIATLMEILTKHFFVYFYFLLTNYL